MPSIVEKSKYAKLKVVFAERDISAYVSEELGKELVHLMASTAETDNSVATIVNGFNITKRVPTKLFLELLSILKSNSLVEYTSLYLKCMDRTVLKITGDKYEVVDEGATLPYSLRGTMDINIQSWRSRRGVTMSRENLKMLVNALQLPQTDPAVLSEAMKDLTLTDCYWTTTNPKERWEEVNLFDNKFSEAIATLAFTGISQMSIQAPFRTPELTTHGAYRKAWVRNGTKIELYKGNSKGLESQVEIFVSEALHALGIPHIRYWEGNFQGQFACVCENMTEGKYNLIHATDYLSYLNRTQGDWRKVVEKETLYWQMILVDGLIKNRDRHSGNWGWLEDPLTGKVWMHPLYDHNNAMDFTSPEEPSIFYPEKTLLDAGKYAYKKLGSPSYVKDYITWLRSKDAQASAKHLFGRGYTTYLNKLLERAKYIMT